MSRNIASPAFTLTELLVVLIIIGLLIALTSSIAPRYFERMAGEQSKSTLHSDLDRLSFEARKRAQFGAFVVRDDGTGYSLELNGAQWQQVDLPSGITLSPFGTSVPVDPAGRYAPGTLTLESASHVEVFSFDAITGRATQAGHGTYGSAHRLNDPRHKRDNVSSRYPDHASNRIRSANANNRHRDRSIRLAARFYKLAIARQLWARRRISMAAFLFRRRGQVAAIAARPLHGGGSCSGSTTCSNHSRNGMGRTDQLGPAHSEERAFTLLEALVTLTIVSLTTALALSSLEPWLRQSRAIGTEAQFWQSLPAAQLATSEIVSGRINPENAASVTSQTVEFESFTPRLSPTPQTAKFEITEDSRGRFGLTVRFGALEGVLLSDAPPLHFNSSNDLDAVILEARIGNQWRPVVIADWPANAPLSCIFDLISRECR